MCCPCLNLSRQFHAEVIVRRIVDTPLWNDMSVGAQETAKPPPEEFSASAKPAEEDPASHVQAPWLSIAACVALLSVS